MQGYVVAAPDYVGLGVAKDAHGKPLVHPYLANPSHANDLFYAVEAAQAAFPCLSKKFVIMGHSPGGGVAWGAAVPQAKTHGDGYLGAVVGSPVTIFIGLAETTKSSDLIAFIARALSGLVPGFKLGEFLTLSGIRRLTLMGAIQGCLSTSTDLFAGAGLVQSNWSTSRYAQAYDKFPNPAGKPVAAPVFVLQSQNESAVPFSVTAQAVHETCTQYPESQLQYATFAGVPRAAYVC